MVIVQHLLLIGLNARGFVIGAHELCIGTDSACLVDVKEALRATLLMGAKSVIMAHNHPSGVAEPSEEDIAIGKKLNKAFDLCGMQFLDNIIVAGEKCYSLREAGYLD